MDTKTHEHAHKETTDNDTEEVFPKGPLGPILGVPKQYEPSRQGGQRSYDGDRLNPNGQIFEGNEKTSKAVY
jgi:hypothetical protein